MGQTNLEAQRAEVRDASHGEKAEEAQTVDEEEVQKMLEREDESTL